MNPLLIKYGLIALAFIGWTTGVYFYATGHEARIWEASTERLKAEAATKINELNEQSAEKDRLNAEHARNTDEMYIAMVNDAAAGRSNFERLLRDARRRASCGSQMSGPAPATGGGQDAAPSGDDGPSGADPGNRLRDAVMSLQAYAKACHQWAIGVGR